MKKYLYLIIFTLIATNVLAITFNDLVSFERDKDNNICDKGEFPIIDKDCKLDFSDIFNEIWFWKILLIVVIVLMAKKRNILNKQTIIIIFIALLVLSIPTETKEKPQGEVVKINKTEPEVNLLEKTTSEKIIDFIASLGKRISPERPWLGWAFILLFLWFVSSVTAFGEDIKDRYVNFKLKNILRRIFK